MITENQAKDIIQYCRIKKPKSIALSKNNFDALTKAAKVAIIKGADRDAALVHQTFIVHLWNNSMTDDWVLEQEFDVPMIYDLPSY